MHHERRILSATVSKSENNEKLAQLVIASSGFLYHQIRYTVTILLKIGVGLEKVELIDELLDIVTNPQRPQMHMASDAPLILTNCEFGIREDGFGDANGKIEAKYNMPVKNKTEEFVMYLLVSTSQCPVEGWPEHPQEDGSDHGKHVRRFVASIFGMCIDLLGSFLDL